MPKEKRLGVENWVQSNVSIAVLIYQLLNRDFSKYVKRIAQVELINLFTREAAATYFLMRFLDDVIDGDRELPDGYDSIPEFIGVVEAYIATGQPADFSFPNKVLFDRALHMLTQKVGDEQVVRETMVHAIRSMMVDYYRSAGAEKIMLSEAELNEYFWTNLGAFHDMLLMGLQTELRSNDNHPRVKAWSTAQAFIQSMRDIEEDWAVGIYNVPKEVLKPAEFLDEQGQLLDGVSARNVKANGYVREWMHTTLQTHLKRLDSFMHLLVVSKNTAGYQEQLFADGDSRKRALLLRFVGEFMKRGRNLELSW